MAEVLLYLTGASWSEDQLSEAAIHEAAVRGLLSQSENFIAILGTSLDPDRRSLVELGSWLQHAAEMYQEQLKLSLDDFMTAAMEVYTELLNQEE